MKLFESLRTFSSTIFHRARLEREMDEELRFHIANRTDDLMHSEKLARAEAERRARLEFGGYQKYKEEIRESVGAHFAETLLQDIRCALRMLRKSPGFTAVTVLTLALGIGANTAIFSIVEAVLLRPLPLKHADRVVTVDQNSAYLPLANWANGTATLESAAEYEWGNLNFRGEATAQRIPAAEVSENFFRVFAEQPLIGRTFLPEEEQPGHSPVAILRHDLWVTQYHSDHQVVGKKCYVNGKLYTVIGVLPEKFDFPNGAQVWVPLPQKVEEEIFGGNAFSRFAIARLRPNATLSQAQRELQALANRQAHSSEPVLHVTLERLQRFLVGDTRLALFLLFGAVGFVLLIACADVANLLLARGAGRSREVATRQALGATRFRLSRQFLSESILLSLLGAILGLFLGWWTIQSAAVLIPARTAFAAAVSMNGWVLAFTFGIAILTGILAGLIPSLRFSRCDLTHALQGGGNSQSWLRPHSPNHIRRLLGVLEIALALILSIGAVLFLRSFDRLSSVDPGFHAGNVLTARLTVVGPKYKNEAQRAVFFQQILTRARALPGVQAAALANVVPLAHMTIIAAFNLQTDGLPRSASVGVGALYTSASRDYFRAMGIPLLAGRDFNDPDTHGTASAAIISKSLARAGWPGKNPIGHHFTFLGAKQQYTVIGIVGDVRQFGQSEEIMPQLYLSSAQEPPDEGFLVIRSYKNPMAFVSTVRDLVRAVDPAEPISSFQTMDQLLSESVARQRFQALLTSIFGGLAVTLALIGVYGVISYNVGQRTNEIGIRMALGAQPSTVLRTVLGEGLLLAIIGVVAGICGALALVRFLASLLFEIKPSDPATFIGVAILLLLVSLVACYIPARRAMKVDPMVALRYES